MAGQDIKKRLPAGGAQPVNVSGDYIYLKFADRPIDVIVSDGRSGQTRVTMEAGDKYRPGAFGQFEIVNPDVTNPAQIIMTVGEGDYNRQIVQGEIAAKTFVIRSDGTRDSDRRRTVELSVYPQQASSQDVTAGGIVAQVTPETSPLAVFDDGRNLYLYDNTGSSRFRLEKRDLATLAPKGFTPEFDLSTIGEFDYLLGCRGCSGHSEYAYAVTREEQFLIRIHLPTGTVEKLSETAITNYSTVRAIAVDDTRGELLFVRQPAPELAEFEVFTIDGLERVGVETLETFSYGSASFMHRGNDGEWVIVHNAAAKLMRAYRTVGGAWEPVRTPGGAIEESDMREAGVVPLIAAPSERVTVRPNHFYFYDGPQLVKAHNSTRTLGQAAMAANSRCFTALPLLKKTGLALAVPTTAAITVSDEGDGKLISGEVIRAVLEWHFQCEVLDGYMDYVFGVRYLDRGVERGINTHAESLAYAKVEDNFQATLPGSFTLIIDDRLPLGTVADR